MIEPDIMRETHRSTCNTWECDENGHMNVQFFFKRFEEAAAVFLTMFGVGNSGNQPVGLRHVRFYREVLAANALRVESGVISGENGTGMIGHRMINAVTDDLCATALDQCVDLSGNLPLMKDGLAEAVLPRGLPVGETAPFDSAALLEAGDAMTSNHSLVRNGDTDDKGRLFSSRIVSMFTDGAPHVWEKAGVTTQWLEANNFGRVAVEMKVAHLAITPPGTMLRLISRINGMEGRTFRIDHQVETIDDGQVIATGSVRCLVMSLETRKAVCLPKAMTGTN